MNVPQDRSNRCFYFQLDRSKPKVTVDHVKERPGNNVNLAYTFLLTAGGSRAGGRSAHCKQTPSSGRVRDGVARRDGRIHVGTSRGNICACLCYGTTTTTMTEWIVDMSSLSDRIQTSRTSPSYSLQAQASRPHPSSLYRHPDARR